jgi:hypothetical protein
MPHGLHPQRTDPETRCWHCSYFEALVYGGTAAQCRIAGGPRIRSAPRIGCAFFEREPGADDEPGRVPAPRVCALPNAKVSAGDPTRVR